MKKDIKKEPLPQRKGASTEKCEEYAGKLSRMIECRTVWTESGENASEFERFYRTLEELFPALSAGAKRLVFGDGCFFYVIEGENAEKNLLLMSHHDVVDATDRWDTDPFD